MSRWIEQFNNHQFQIKLHNLISDSESLVILDVTVKTDVEELARLKKALTYIEQLIKACDPELMPLGVLDNSLGQADSCIQQINAFRENKNIAHLQNANGNLDNVISYIRPYIISQEQAAQAAQTAFIEYSNTITSQIENLKNTTQNTIKEIDEFKTKSESSYKEIDDSKKGITEYEKTLFQGNENEKSLKEKIQSVFDDSNKFHSEINNYYQKLVTGNEHGNSIISQISNAKDTALKESAMITDKLKGTEKEIKELGEFYKEIFGTEDNKKELSGGLKQEIAIRILELEKFKKEQNEKYNTLLKEIETLLPGATSAGLSTAYCDLKKEHKKQSGYYSLSFYGLLALLTLYGAYSFHNHGNDNLIQWGESIIHSLPFLTPLFFIILTASKRRSEHKRLEEEYAHKESLAKSFYSFKKQIDSLQQKDEELTKKLLDKTIDAVSFNASTTLDGKHGDKIPLQKIAEKGLETLKEVKNFNFSK